MACMNVHVGLAPSALGGFCCSKAAPALAAGKKELSAAKPCNVFLVHPATALTFNPSQDGVLRVMQGGIWLTFGPLRRANRFGLNKAGLAENIHRYGDHFLTAGDTLRLARGDAVVVEFWRASPAGSPIFQFEPGVAISA